MRNIIIKHDYANSNWTELIKEAKRKIAEMQPYEVLALCFHKYQQGIFSLADMAFIAAVSKAVIHVEMSRGELYWKLTMSNDVPSVSENFYEVAISWVGYIPNSPDGYSYIKTLVIPYEECKFDVFVSTIQEEMPIVLVDAVMADINLAFSQIVDDEETIQKCKVMDLLKSGKFNESMKTFLQFKKTFNKYDITSAIEIALVNAIRTQEKEVQQLLSSGKFVYDLDEGEVIFVVMDHDFGIKPFGNSEYKLEVIIREYDDLGLPYCTDEVKTTFRL